MPKPITVPSPKVIGRYGIVHDTLMTAIIIVDFGRLAEDGSHEELIKTGGRYATLLGLQAAIHDVG
jgi:hypothetical protein